MHQNDSLIHVVMWPLQNHSCYSEDLLWWMWFLICKYLHAPVCRKVWKKTRNPIWFFVTVQSHHQLCLVCECNGLRRRLLESPIFISWICIFPLQWYCLSFYFNCFVSEFYCQRSPFLFILLHVVTLGSRMCVSFSRWPQNFLSGAFTCNILNKTVL